MGRKRKQTGVEEEGARNVLTIGLMPETNAAVDRWLVRNHGWGKAAFVRMLIEWFTAAPESVQHIVAGTVPADMREEFKQRATEWIAERIEAVDARSPELSLTGDAAALILQEAAIRGITAQAAGDMIVQEGVQHLPQHRPPAGLETPAPVAHQAGSPPAAPAATSRAPKAPRAAKGRSAQRPQTAGNH